MFSLPPGQVSLQENDMATKKTKPKPAPKGGKSKGKGC